MAKKIFSISIILFIIFSGLGGCNSATEKNSDKTKASGQPSLPLPVPPAAMTDPEERADYIVTHYWDALDLNNRKQCLDTSFMEQSFANCVPALQCATPKAVNQSFSYLIKKCEGDEQMICLIEVIAHKYLAESNSPLRSEDLYIPFLEILSSSDVIPSDVRFRTLERLAEAKKNRPGSKAPDFSLSLADGSSSTLHSIVAANDTIVVMFYDPDCDRCHTITEQLKADPSRLPYRILSVSVNPDRQLWNRTKGNMPSSWINAFAAEPITERETYIFPALPSFYLMAPDATIILKDFPL